MPCPWAVLTPREVSYSDSSGANWLAPQPTAAIAKAAISQARPADGVMRRVVAELGVVVLVGCVTGPSFPGRRPLTSV